MPIVKTTVVKDLLPQVHMLGEGMVGETAFSGKHKWISWDADDDSDSEFTRLISSGIKTICMIPLDSQGVIQLGSIHKISERQEFVDQTKILFSDMEKAESFDRITSSTASSVTCDAASSDLNEWFDSLCAGSISPIHGGTCDDLLDEFGFTSSNFTQSYIPTSDVDCMISTWSNENEGSILTVSEIEVCDFPWILSPSGNLQGNATLAPCNSTQEYIKRSWIQNESLITLFGFPEEFNQVDFFIDFSNFLMPFDWIPCSQSHSMTPQVEVNVSQSVGRGENLMANLVNGVHPSTREEVSKYISTSNGGWKHKGLFSELGVEEPLGGLKSSSFSSNNSSIIDAGLLSSVKRRKMENLSSSSSLSVNQLQLRNRVSCSAASSSTSMLLSASSLDKAKSPMALLIEESYSSINKKRARPGESSRTRPKDRQQIQDRLKELRGIVPNAEKDSIDNLLDKTIRHMRFLQNVAKYAEQLKQVDKPKISKDEGGCGATWALEVGDETVVYPVIVKDLVPPGLMLVEILCKDEGYFLEIAEAVKGFGLNILKGEMEGKDDNKIWAQFVMEESSSMTRADVVWSIVPLRTLAPKC